MSKKSGGLYGQEDLAQEGIYANNEGKTADNGPETVDIEDEDDELAMANMLEQMKSRVRQQGMQEDVDELTDDEDSEDENEDHNG